MYYIKNGGIIWSDYNPPKYDRGPFSSRTAAEKNLHELDCVDYKEPSLTVKLQEACPDAVVGDKAIAFPNGLFTPSAKGVRIKAHVSESIAVKIAALLKEELDNCSDENIAPLTF